MTDLLDKNGNATETHIATVSGFDFTTGEHIATYDVRILAGTGIPGFSTLTLAPASDSGCAVCWNGAAWEQVLDLRGTTAYEKVTGSPVTVENLGPLSEELTSAAPATEFDKWDGSAWVTDTDAQHAAAVTAAELYAQQLIDAAMQSISVIQLKLQAERTLTDTEKTKLNNVLDYIDAVNAVDKSTAPVIVWPQNLVE